MTRSRFKELVVDIFMGFIFALFLLFYTPFTNSWTTWFCIMIIFNLILELYKYSYREILKERQDDEE